MVLKSGTKSDRFFFNNTEMKNINEEKILVIIIANKLKFKSHEKTHARKLLKRSRLYHV